MDQLYKNTRTELQDRNDTDKLYRSQHILIINAIFVLHREF